MLIARLGMIKWVGNYFFNDFVIDDNDKTRYFMQITANMMCVTYQKDVRWNIKQ